MAKTRHKCGDKLCFHGSFASKTAAQAKEADTPNSFILKRRVRGRGVRYIVATERNR